MIRNLKKITQITAYWVLAQPDAPLCMSSEPLPQPAVSSFDKWRCWDKVKVHIQGHKPRKCQSYSLNPDQFIFEDSKCYKVRRPPLSWVGARSSGLKGGSLEKPRACGTNRGPAGSGQFQYLHRTNPGKACTCHRNRNGQEEAGVLQGAAQRPKGGWSTTGTGHCLLTEEARCHSREQRAGLRWKKKKKSGLKFRV